MEYVAQLINIASFISRIILACYAPKDIRFQEADVPRLFVETGNSLPLAVVSMLVLSALLLIQSTATV
jgi:hypothetical protein